MKDDGYPDVAVYNNELQALDDPSWLKVSWLYAECYLFRSAPHCPATQWETAPLR